MGHYIGTIIENCDAEILRTGVGNCPKKEGKTVGLILTAANALYSVDHNTFRGGMEEYVHASGYMRMYPIKNIVTSAVSGGDVNAPEVGTYGGSAPVGINAINIVYQIDAGDCLYKELLKIRKRKMRVFRVDDEGYIYGTLIHKDGVDYNAGFLVTVYPTLTPTDGSTSYNLSLAVYYTPNYESELANMNAFAINGIPDGLIAVSLSGNNPGHIITWCSATDVTQDYVWTAEAFLNKSGANPTSVVSDPATGALTITPTGEYRIAPANVLKAAGIYGLDGEEIFIQV